MKHGNLHLGKNEDFETLISDSSNASNFAGEQSAMVCLASKLYPIKLVLHSAVTIMVCSLVADEVVSQVLAGDQGRGQYLFGILPALNSNHKPVPETELIKMSRGFLICAILAFAFGLVAQVISCSQSSSQGQSSVRRAPSAHRLMGKIFGVVALLVGAMMQLPAATQHSLLVGNFESVRFASVDGLNGSISACLFYAGVLVFSDGMLVLKLPAIASSQRKSLPGAADPPLILASMMSWLVKWLYCILASTALVNS